MKEFIICAEVLPSHFLVYDLVRASSLRAVWCIFKSRNRRDSRLRFHHATASIYYSKLN